MENNTQQSDEMFYLEMWEGDEETTTQQQDKAFLESQHNQEILKQQYQDDIEIIGEVVKSDIRRNTTRVIARVP